MFIVAFAVSSLALARRVNVYRTAGPSLTFFIDKEDVLITNSVAGRLDSIKVTEGQYVTAGEVLAELKDDNLESQLSVLDEFSEENLSARTEAELLRSKSNEYVIASPRNGIIHEIKAATGSYLPPSSQILTMFADTDAKLVAYVDSNQLDEIQRQSSLEVYSDRLEQSFIIVFTGVSRAVTDRTDGRNFEVVFEFEDTTEGQAFIEGESLIVLGVDSDAAQRPGDIITDLWNRLIIGN